MTNDSPVYEICKIPAGSKVSRVETDDPMSQRFRIEEPDGAIRTIDLGPSGVVVTYRTNTADSPITIDVGDASQPAGCEETIFLLMEMP